MFNLLNFPSLFNDNRNIHQENNEGESSVDKVLERIAHGWDGYARVRHFDWDRLPEYNPDKPDFLPELLPFGDLSIYHKADPDEKNKMLTIGWQIYNYRTLVIEEEIVGPFCLSVMNGVMPGLRDENSILLAKNTSIDENFHSYMVRKANEINERERKFSFDVPEFNLVRNMKETMNNAESREEKNIVLAVTATVSEIFISSYLSQLGDSHEVSEFNQMIVHAHYQDELVHGKIFSNLAMRMYHSLNEKNKAYYSRVIGLPAYWFSDPEFEVWRSALTAIGFKNTEAMLSEAQERYKARGMISNGNYSELVKLCADLGITSAAGVGESLKRLSNT